MMNFFEDFNEWFEKHKLKNIVNNDNFDNLRSHERLHYYKLFLKETKNVFISYELNNDNSYQPTRIYFYHKIYMIKNGRVETVNCYFTDYLKNGSEVYDEESSIWTMVNKAIGLYNDGVFEDGYVKKPKEIIADIIYGDEDDDNLPF